MNDQIPFIIDNSKYDPRHIGLPQKRFYFLVLVGNPFREWYFIHTRTELFVYLQKLDNDTYKSRVQIFKIQKDKRSSSYYVFFKVFDNLHDFMDDEILKDYKAYIDTSDPQKNLINQLLS